MLHRFNRCWRNLLLDADVITPVVCTDAPSVEPVLKKLLLGTWHRLWYKGRPMHRCPFLDRRFNRCLKADLALIPSCTKHHGVGFSDYHRMLRCPWRRIFRCFWSEELSGRCPEPRRGGPSGLAMPIFSFTLSSLKPKSLRMVILTIMLVQVLCCHSITKITRNGINGAMFVTVGILHGHSRD